MILARCFVAETTELRPDKKDIFVILPRLTRLTYFSEIRQIVDCYLLIQQTEFRETLS